MSHNLKQWILVTRPWSFPASGMPALVAVAFAFHQYKNHLVADINWLNATLAIIGAVVFQTAGNLISDYYDYVNKVDRKESYGSNRMVIDGIFKPKTVLKYGLSFLTIGCSIGIYLCAQSSIYLLIFGLIGALGTLFYYKLKYNALGDLLIFLIFGLLIGPGTYYVTTNILSYESILISMPLGLLIVAILHANNTRDIMHDKQIGIKTSAMLFGIKGSKIKYALLLILSYIILIILILIKILPYSCLSVLLTLPFAIKNIMLMNSFSEKRPINILRLDAKTSQLVLLFAILLSISIFVF
ncbi:prenyltransferase [Bacteroidales bacterium OttesenSCG-928-K22]|nr:prenyltransferase [Bacteroidales bacterium OttesenSCG-928-L14]MDL2240683.1 prenyltransferase [Bacteroidales bacterium OttesenSCG-928-K22]